MGLVSVDLAQLELLEDLCSWEDAWVDDARHGESPTHDSTDGCEEMIERRPGLVVPHRDGIQIVPEN